jgi:hypothetical protein
MKSDAQMQPKINTNNFKPDLGVKENTLCTVTNLLKTWVSQPGNTVTTRSTHATILHVTNLSSKGAL